MQKLDPVGYGRVQSLSNCRRSGAMLVASGPASQKARNPMAGSPAKCFGALKGGGLGLCERW